jgi:hypothetical protein
VSAAITSGTINVLVGGDSPISRSYDKIQSFGRLPVGWHYGRGGPARPNIVRIAISYLWNFLTLGFGETDAFPGVGGEIMVTAYRGRHCIEITVELDKTFVVTHEFNEEDRYHESGLSEADAYTQLRTITTSIQREACATSFSSISTITMITGQVDLTTWPLSLQAIQWEPPSSRRNAALTQAAQSAPTSTNIILGSAVIPQYSGGLTVHKSIPVAA